MNEEKIIERFKDLRKEHNLTMREMAEKLQLSENMISLIERGKRNVSKKVIQRVYDQFGENIIVMK